MFDSIVLVLLGFFGDGDGVMGHLNADSINCIRSSFIRYCTDICNRSFSISSSHSCRYSIGIFCYEYSPFDSDFVFAFFSPLSFNCLARLRPLSSWDLHGQGPCHALLNDTNKYQNQSLWRIRFSPKKRYPGHVNCSMASWWLKLEAWNKTTWTRLTRVRRRSLVINTFRNPPLYFCILSFLWGGGALKLFWLLTWTQYLGS